MREIKFRAWDKEQKEWVKYSITDNIPIFCHNTSRWKTDKEGKRFILCQYTGLKNFNGKEIYEGDIVRAIGFSKWIGVAKYSDKNQAFVFECIDKNYRGNIVFMSQFDQGFKILGNIFENPKLLEEASDDN
jgi:hypothetical protein|nr:MAG TPA: YopX protein [Caudoviricetes sp.]